MKPRLTAPNLTPAVLALCLAAFAPTTRGAIELLTETYVAAASAIQGNGGSGSKVSLFSLRMVRPIEDAGTVTGVGPQTLSDSTATWANDQFNGPNGAFYVEFDSGYTAQIVDTDAATGTLTLAAGVQGLVSAGEPYRIRRHATISSMFGPQNEAGLKSGLNPTEADNILLHLPETQVTVTIFYYDDGSGGEGWLRADYSLAADQVIYPEQGIMVQRKAPADVLLHFLGPVKVGPAVVPLYPGYNLVGTLKASTALRLTDLDLYTGNATTGLASGLNPTAGDNLLVVATDGATTTYFYYNDFSGGEGWLDAAYNLANDVTIPPGSAFFVRRKPPRAVFDWTIPME